MGLASDEQILDQLKSLYLTIKHKFSIKTLFIVIIHHFQKTSCWVPIILASLLNVCKCNRMPLSARREEILYPQH